jgi:hypothetical protein
MVPETCIQGITSKLEVILFINNKGPTVLFFTFYYLLSLQYFFRSPLFLFSLDKKLLDSLGKLCPRLQCEGEVTFTLIPFPILPGVNFTDDGALVVPGCGFHWLKGRIIVSIVLVPLVIKFNGVRLFLS